MGRSKWIVMALAAVVVVGAIVALSSKAPTTGLVNADEFARLQEQGVRIVDVRTAAEYSAGHIPGAESVPLSAFSSVAEGWDPEAPVALYCATGSRSAEAAQMLAQRGFETVYDLSGGIIAWNGPVSGGTGTASDTPAQAATGVAVMYEFYTDW